MNRSLRLLQQAGDSLLSNRLRSFLMMLGLVIGIASLTAVICIGQGTRAQVMDMVAKQGWDLIMIRAGSAKQVFAPTTDRTVASLMEADTQAIEAGLGNIRYVSSVQNQRGWEVVYGDQSVKTRIFGVGPTWHYIRRRPVERGEFLSQADLVNMNRVAILGFRTAKMLFGAGDPIGQTIRIGSEAFQVKGVFVEAGITPGGDDWDDRIVIPFTTSSKRLFGRLYLEQIVVQVRDARKLHQTAEQIRKLLRERHQIRAGAEDDFFVREPEDVKETALTTSSTLTTLLIAISAISMLVGGVVIMNLMLISVSQRVHEIGLRLTVGARPRDILVQFLFEALGVALAGGVLGAAGGAGIASLLAWKGVAVSQITWIPFAISIAACTLVAVAFGLYPARKAARLDPVAALREKRM
ncbi:MAG: ABC transporter permease [Acidobacteriia bacterium]|nr:ABC transporter permease [Terriglobia bacterium]